MSTFAGLWKSFRDGWSNAVTGIGIAGKDPALANIFSASPHTYIDWEEASKGGIPKRIVHEIPDHAFREWGDVYAQDAADALQLTALVGIWKLREIIKQALITARRDGGCGIVCYFESDLDLLAPLDLAKVGALRSIKYYSSKELKVDKVYVNSENFDEPSLYSLSMTSSTGAGTLSYKIHPSRVIRIEGEAVPRKSLATYSGWGRSVLEGDWSHIGNFEIGMSAASRILQAFAAGVLSIKDLASLLATDPDGSGKEAIRQRVDFMMYTMSQANAIVVDKEGESFTRDTISLVGFSDVIDRTMAYLCAVTRHPLKILFGWSPKGLGQESDSDLKRFYAQVADVQTEKLTGPLLQLLQILNMKFLSGRASDIAFTWKPLDPLSEKERADIREVTQRTDCAYIDYNVLTDAEVRQSRFSGEYTTETTIDPKSDMSVETAVTQPDFPTS